MKKVYIIAEIGVNHGDMHEADWYEEDDGE